VIIFCGAPGTGKTSLAPKVSKRLNITCLHKDVIKENLYDLYEGRSLEDSRIHGQISIQLLVALAESNIKNGVSIILEAPFNHQDNPKLFQEWIDTYGIDLKIVVLSVAEDERIQRMRDRERHGSHHDEQRMREGQFRYENFDYSIMPGEKLLLNTSATQDELVERILAFIEEE
jgi:predicted kinase